MIRNAPAPPDPVTPPLLQKTQQFGKQALTGAKSIQRQFGYKCDHNSARHTLLSYCTLNG
jgi:hypothetical protein